MSKTKIEWADKVWNPVTGCTPISEGCEHCYAKRMAKRLRGRCGYPEDDPFRVTWHEDRLDEPKGWKKPQRIFVCSMGDLFHESINFQKISRIVEIMEMCPQYTFMLLTKRPEKLNKFILAYFGKIFTPKGIAEILCNIWFGVTCENQARADERIPILLQIPAAKRFISIEPMLGPVDLTALCYGTHDVLSGREFESLSSMEDDLPKLDWVILGGETGPGARPMHPDWVRSIRDQCGTSGVPLFFKTWGDYRPDKISVIQESIWRDAGWINNAKGGHILDGKEYREFPSNV